MKSKFRNRARFISICFIFVAFILIFRLFKIQILNNDFYLDAAEQQYVRKPEGSSERGSIFFETKQKEFISAATQIVNFHIEINPSMVQNDEELFNVLNTVIDLNKDSFFKQVSRKNSKYEIVAKRVSREKADKILALKLKNVKVIREKERFYPGNNLASHVVGFVGFNQNKIEGRYGLEKQYENVLARPEENPYVNFFAEIFTNIKDTFFDSKNKQGDILISIEPTVQNFLEKELELIKNKYNADSLGGIIINPRNGEIYAMSSKPDFDLNNFSKMPKNFSFSNPLVESVFEFGSVFKPIVMASAFDAKVINLDTTYNDTGSVQVEKKVISNFDKKGRGPNTTMEKVMGQSLNTGMVLIYQKLGKEKFKDYILSFGIREKTNIDLPGEVTGLTSNLNSARELEFANASFGQGIALTPINLVRALSALANDGIMPTPHLVKKIQYKNNKIEEISYPTHLTKISKEASRQITEILVAGMDKYLKNGNAKIENYSIATKTGTAQVPNHQSGGYYSDRNLHSFFGYFPASDPKMLVFLYAMNPKNSSYASTTWTDSFLKITKFLINYYELPPDR